MQETLDNRLIELRKMNLPIKNKLSAIWISKQRMLEFKSIDILFLLDDEWERVYSEFRIKEGFSAASLRATTHVFNTIYGE